MIDWHNLPDVNSLLGTPMQPWGLWDGYKSLPMEEWTGEDYRAMDQLSVLTLDADNNYQALLDFAETNGKIRAQNDLDTVTNGLICGGF